MATTYYVSSSSGNDNYSGMLPDSAWETLTHLNSINFFPGDSVLLKSDDVFLGTIRIHNSGSTSAPIYFGKFGTGEKPIISGFKKITGWNNTGNIYSVTDTSNVKSIWFNGKWMQPARYPNTGFISTQSSNVGDFVFNNLLNQPDGYWDNANVAIRSEGIKYEMRKVDTFFQGIAVFSPQTQFGIPQLSGFFFYNKFEILDTVNEWFCDTLIDHIYLIPPFGSIVNNSTINASVIDYAFYSEFNLNNVVIENIQFVGQSKDAIHIQGVAVSIIIKNCLFKMCKEWAVYFHSTTNKCLLINNDFEDCTGGGIFSEFFFHSKIVDNRINRMGLQKGFGFDDYCQGEGIRLSSAILDTITNNIIDSCGYAGITLYNQANRVEKNLLSNCMLLLDAGGAIVFYGQQSNFNFIADNFILNTNGNIEGTNSEKLSAFGIYFAENIHNDTIINNTIVNSSSYGIYFGPNNQNHYLKNNVIYNNQQGQLFFIDGDTVNATNNIYLNNNILYSLSDKQPDIKLTGASQNFFPIKGDSNYYCNPYDYFPIYQLANVDTNSFYTPFSIPKWTQVTAQDSNSHSSNVQWNNFIAIDTTGSDLIQNGNFTNNYDNWATSPTTNNEVLLDNLTMMDDGCIKFKVTNPLPIDQAKISSAYFPLLQNQFYQFSYSVAGTKNGMLHTDIREHNYPYGQIGLNKFFPINIMRNDYQYLFQSPLSDNPLALNFEIHQNDSLVYFDNIHLFPVSVFKHDSTRMSVLLMNYSPNTISVPLGADSVFRDLDGNIVTGSYTLNPFSSYVLVLDSPLNLVSVKEIEKQKSIQVFPNPVQSSNGKIYIQLPDENKYDYDVYDLTGRKFLSGKFSGSSINTFSMRNASAGMYILSVHSANKLWQQKIVVVN